MAAQAGRSSGPGNTRQNNHSLIRFGRDTIKASFGPEEIRRAARRFYDASEWRAFTLYQQAYIVSTAFKYHHKNRHNARAWIGRKLHGVALYQPEMDAPNFSNVIGANGVEQWPISPNATEATEEQYADYLKVRLWARSDIINQRLWGDRLYFGQMSLPLVSHGFSRINNCIFFSNLLLLIAMC
jgi:hypothetical protein